MHISFGERAFVRFSKRSVTLKTLRITILNAKWHDHEEDSLFLNYIHCFLNYCYMPSIELVGYIIGFLRAKTVLFNTLFLVCRTVPGK